MQLPSGWCFRSLLGVGWLVFASCSPESLDSIPEPDLEATPPAPMLGAGRASFGAEEPSARDTRCANLPLYAATASTSDENVAAGAVDGNLMTRWSGFGAGAFITIDLGNISDVCAIQIAWHRGDVRSSQFAILVSSDNRNFQKIYSAKSSGKTNSFENYGAMGHARYVRVVVSGNSENQWASITELKVSGQTQSGEGAFSDSFSGRNGLITNEYAHWNPNKPDAIFSEDWEMTSGSLFRKDDAAWTGVPDGASPDPHSQQHTGSSVFRLTTKRSDFENIAVSFRLRNDALSTTSRTPAVDWDGVHIFLRYQSEEWLYYASINRRDNTSIIKKKVPGGPSNGGTYYNLSDSVRHNVAYGQWQRVKATITTNGDRSVTIQLFENDRLIVKATDRGTGGPPIVTPGKVGIRADNCNMQFDDFEAEE